MFWPKCTVSLGAALVVLGAHTAQAQSNFFQQVRLQLVQNLDAARDAGMSLSHEPFTGSLYKGYYQTKTLVLDAGVQYAITAVCDIDCTDIDLVVLNRFDTRIGADVETDDRPVVVVQPTETARFQVRASMVSCFDEPCAYGIGVFSRE